MFVQLEDDDARVLLEEPAELPVSDVDGVHPSRAGVEHCLREAARRGTRVERDGAANVEGERPESRLHLLLASDGRHPVVQGDRAGPRHARPRVRNGRAVDVDPALADGRLGVAEVGPALPDLAQQADEPLLRHPALSQGLRQAA